jgi:DNA-directed RNA polymerase omega subunit
LNPTNGIDSKFRFVILAAKRAKQLLHGDKPKIKTKAKNPIRIAQEEVRFGAVDYDIVEPKVEETREPEDEGFIGEVIGGEEEVEEEIRKPSRGRRAKKQESEKEEEEPESDEEEVELEEKEEDDDEDEEEEPEEGDEGSEEEDEK